MNCKGCGKKLEPEFTFKGEAETEYQFDNALWLGFHGGYGMFTDFLDFPTNMDDAYLTDSNGDLLLLGGEVVLNAQYEPEYEEERTLPGRPGIEAVICHECAHDLCDKVQWIAELIHPATSHSHKQEYHEAHPDHYGWDYDRRKNEQKP